ncbi:DegV family protein [Spiroplasma diminutum]|uniref:DegV family protein n=1 Tax=Spiroplasma diminutum CUAS-1 TaxID=1276221 RepID=S5MF62_9MOLU|nr:DegV family protein [Spiroplasma diminutum]AGR42433.1 DegV family protein [Spiroplasma diminutum CUAS-1]
MKIGILVDSSSGYNVSESKSKIVKVIPLHLIVNDKDDYFDTQEQVEENNLMKVLASGIKTTTSQASPGELMNKYDEMLKEFDHIIHLTIPSNLSGMYQTAVMTANDDDYKGKITVINHFLAAKCVELLVNKYEEMINQGITSPEEFQNEADKWAKGSWISIIPGDLKKFAQGGRANSLLITMLKMIKTKVAIQWLEKPQKIGMGRTYSAVLDKMISSLKSTLSNKYKLFLVYLKEANDKVLEQVRSYLNENSVEFNESKIPNVFPWHAGVDTIALIAVDSTLLAKK